MADRLPAAAREALEQGATLAEACREGGLSLQAVWQWCSRGPRAKPGTAAREGWEEIRAAQGVFARQARKILIDAAGKGIPSAVERVLAQTQAQARELEAESIPEDREGYLLYRLRDVRQRLQGETGIAATRLLEAERQLMAELEQVREDRREKPSDLTPAQMMERHRHLAGELAEPHLQIYLAEYLRRHRGQIWLESPEGRLEVFG